MRKIAGILAALFLLFAVFAAGRESGIRHVLYDAEIWTVDCYDPDNPDDSAFGEFDQKIFILVDGEIYVHGMYVG